MFATDSDLKGIGGWLILTVVALAVGPFISLHGVYTDFKVLHAASYQESLAARPELAALILFEGLTNLILLITQIGLNILLYKTRRSFPRWMIAYLIAGIFFTLCDHLWAMHFNHSTQWTAVLQRAVAALVWIPYFLRSRRVELWIERESAGTREIPASPRCYGTNTLRRTCHFVLWPGLSVTMPVSMPFQIFENGSAKLN
jgi:hypothetical protein